MNFYALTDSHPAKNNPIKPWSLKNAPIYCQAFTFNKGPIMSQHNSFKASAGGGKKNRTVLKRFERVDLLRKRGEWEDGNRVIGLKKTKPEE